MVDASDIRKERSKPDTLTHTGSPRGAVKLKRTTVPGKKPISRSFVDISSSVKPDITAVSPGTMFATLLDFATSYLD